MGAAIASSPAEAAHRAVAEAGSSEPCPDFAEFLAQRLRVDRGTAEARLRRWVEDYRPLARPGIQVLDLCPKAQDVSHAC